MKYYLILDKTNLVVKDFKDKEDAEAYVKARPYLRISEFDDSDILHDTVTSNEHHTVSETDDLPF